MGSEVLRRLPLWNDVTLGADLRLYFSVTPALAVRPLKDVDDWTTTYIKSISIPITKIFFQVRCLEESREECQSSESARCNLLTAIDAILTNLLAEDENNCGSSARFHTPQDNLPPVPEKVDFSSTWDCEWSCQNCIGSESVSKIQVWNNVVCSIVDIQMTCFSLYLDTVLTLMRLAHPNYIAAGTYFYQASW